ncbi:hypothetical protein pdam_00025816 [Pocillopora damicornis]|uniref:Uncharacterized protein n=1 Tax=Pocillopora damicornis TaxID=46731 RepID=A0A3M6U082_POCDA|nr:hypothetical protein pdam_00025816 [Pocillopora damicornis]
MYTTPLHMTFPNTPEIIHKPPVYIMEIDQGITTKVTSKSAIAMLTNIKLVSDLTSDEETIPCKRYEHRDGVEDCDNNPLGIWFHLKFLFFQLLKLNKIKLLLLNKQSFTLVESMIFQDVTEAMNRNGNTGNRKRNAAGHFNFLLK